MYVTVSLEFEIHSYLLTKLCTDAESQRSENSVLQGETMAV